MNRISKEKRAQALQLLVEGSSQSTTARIVKVNYKTVSRLLKDAGLFFHKFHNEQVRNLKSRYIQLDEIWTYPQSTEEEGERL